MVLPNGQCHCIMGLMSDTVTLDKAGRLVLPKGIRDELQLGPGDTLEIQTEGQQITLRPRRPRPTLQKEHGVWVFRTGDPLPASVVTDALRQARAERDGRNLGSRG